jgi:hypothetical protein
MHKKLDLELMSIAHEILKMKNREDVEELLSRTNELQQRLSLLSLIQRYEAQPSVEESIEELEEKFDYDKLVSVTEKEDETVDAQEESNSLNEAPVVSDLFTELVIDTQNIEEETEVVEVEKEVEELSDFDQELQGAIDLDLATTLLDEGNVLDVNPSKSINDVVFQNQIQIGLNDRIVFVKHLFNENQEDFNRVISQLNSFKDIKEAKSFIHKVVRPDYDWSSQEELQDRLMNLVERKFA